MLFDYKPHNPFFVLTNALVLKILFFKFKLTSFFNKTKKNKKKLRIKYTKLNLGEKFNIMSIK